MQKAFFAGLFPPLMGKCLPRVVIGLVAAYLVIVGVLLLLEDHLVFRPTPASSRWFEPPRTCVFQDVSLPTSFGTSIHARWFPCGNSSGAVLFCHSNNGNLSMALSPEAVARWHQETGLSVLVFDYPGYGRSAGAPTEPGCYSAADAAYNWLIMDRSVSPRQILIVGRSLGTAVAVDLASRHDHRALVLISPFTSMPDVVQTRYPVLPAQLLMRNRFDSLSTIGQCQRPLLVFHGTADWKVPFALGKSMFQAANEPRRFITVPEAGHNDTVLVNFFPELRDFLEEFAQ